MICIKLNGKEKSVSINTSLKDLLLEVKEGPFAVAINKEFVPQADYKSTILRNGDELELVIPMQGG